MTGVPADTDIQRSALPGGTEAALGVKFLPDGRTLIRHPYRRADGVASWKQVTLDTRDKRKIAKAMLDLAVSVEGSLKTPTFGECVEHYLHRHGGGEDYGGMRSCFDGRVGVRKALGRVKVNDRLLQAYHKYTTSISGERKPNTVNNYRICVRSVLNYAYRTGLIDRVPIRDYGITAFEYRERVWTQQERQRIFNVLDGWDSHLKWAVYFAALNPIRKTDQFGLTREALDMTNRVVRFRPRKTGRRKQRLTILPNIDDTLMGYFLSLPGECPWLFPMVATERNGMHTKMKPGQWRRTGDPKRHFRSVCAAADVDDFHWHDLKHVAVTYMIEEQGYSYERLRKLGIQYSEKTARVYHNRDALEIIRDMRATARSSFVAVQEGTHG